MNRKAKRLKLLGVVVALASIALAGGPDLDRARKLYNLTDFDQSLKVLQESPQKDASIYQLMGRDYYMLSDYKKATEVLEKAVAADPASSENALWLARAYGRRAEASNPISAAGQAETACRYFY